MDCQKKSDHQWVQHSGDDLVYLARDGQPVEVPAHLTMMVCAACGRVWPYCQQREAAVWLNEVFDGSSTIVARLSRPAHGARDRKKHKVSVVKRRALRGATARAMGARRHDLRTRSGWFHSVDVRRRGGDRRADGGSLVTASSERELRFAFREAVTELRAREDLELGELRRAPTKRELGIRALSIEDVFARCFVAIERGDHRAVVALAREYKTLRGHAFARMRYGMLSLAWMVSARAASVVNVLTLLAATRTVAQWFPERESIARALEIHAQKMEPLQRASLLRALSVCFGDKPRRTLPAIATGL